MFSFKNVVLVLELFRHRILVDVANDKLNNKNSNTIVIIEIC